MLHRVCNTSGGSGRCFALNASGPWQTCWPAKRRRTGNFPSAEFAGLPARKERPGRCWKRRRPARIVISAFCRGRFVTVSWASMEPLPSGRRVGIAHPTDARRGDVEHDAFRQPVAERRREQDVRVDTTRSSAGNECWAGQSIPGTWQAPQFGIYRHRRAA